MNTSKLKNPVFWIGLVSAVLLAGGVDFETLTSWKLLSSAVFGILSNPVALALSVTTAYSIFNDNGTKGLDKIKIKK